MQYYHGVIYFRSGSTRTTSPCNNRQVAEKLAAQAFDQAMRTAVSDYFKPTRFEVVED